MVFEIFHSNKNIESIQQSVQDQIKKEYSIDSSSVSKPLNKAIVESIKFVETQVKDKVPIGMTQEDYLKLMNKKVVQLVYPIMKENIQKQSKKIQPSQTNQIQLNQNQSGQQSQSTPIRQLNDQKLTQNIFDTSIIQNYEVPDVIDYPKPNAQKENMDNRLKQFESDREAMFPKVEQINFSIKDDKKRNTMEDYNNLVSSYNQFDMSQKQRNTEIEKLEHFENQKWEASQNNFSTPINSLQPVNSSVSSQNSLNQVYEQTHPKDMFMLNKQNNSTQQNSLTQQSSLIQTMNTNPPRVSNQGSLSQNNLSQNIGQNFSQTQNFSQNINSLTSIPNSSPFSDKSKPLTEHFSLQTIPPNFAPDIRQPPMMLEMSKRDLQYKTYYVIFSSLDRNFEEYPNPFSFQMKFSPNSNNFIYTSVYDSKGTLVLLGKNVSYGDSSRGNIQQTFDDVYSIAIKSAIVPTNITYYGFSSSPRESELLTLPKKNIFHLSGLYLVIPEIRGPYIGGNNLFSNSFAKLIVDYGQNNNFADDFYFTLMRTADTNEFFLYDPVLQGKLDKMTFNLLTGNGAPFACGLDKLYIKEIQRGSSLYLNQCSTKQDSTIIVIQNNNPEYASYCQFFNNNNCDIINSHTLEKNDLIYFYNTRPSGDQIAFFEDYINIYDINVTGDTTKIKIGYLLPSTNEIVTVSIQDVIKGANVIQYDNYYLVVQVKNSVQYYFLNIEGFDGEYIVVQSHPYITNLVALTPTYPITNLRIGIVKKNLAGSQSELANTFFSKSGWNVISVGQTDDTYFNVEINFPYDQLPEWIHNDYQPNDVFLIQDCLQINYTFEIKIKTRDVEPVRSSLNLGGNF